MKDIIVITENGGRQVVTHTEDLNDAMRYVADFGHKVESAHFWEDDPQNAESEAYGSDFHPHEIMAIREMIGEVIGWNEYDVEVLGVDYKREFATCVILDDGAHTGDLVPVSLWLLLA